MTHYDSIDSVPELPSVEGKYISFRSDLGYSVRVGWGGDDRWVVMTDPDDGRRGYLELHDGLFNINVSGNPTGSATSIESWQGAVRLFF